MALVTLDAAIIYARIHPVATSIPQFLRATLTYDFDLAVQLVDADKGATTPETVRNSAVLKVFTFLYQESVNGRMRSPNPLYHSGAENLLARWRPAGAIAIGDAE